MKYRLEVWETENDREEGYATRYFDIPELDDLEKAIELARDIYYKEGYACVEVVNNERNRTAFNIDYTGGDRYE